MSEPQPPGVIKLELKHVDLPELLKIDELLGRAPVFRLAGTTGLAQLLGAARTRRFTDGQRVFAEGSPGTSLFVVLRGEVALGRGSGASATELATLGKGEFFGESEVLGGTDAQRAYTASARGQTDLAELPQDKLAPLLEARFELYGLLRETRDQRARTKDELSDFLDRW